MTLFGKVMIGVAVGIVVVEAVVMIAIGGGWK